MFKPKSSDIQIGQEVVRIPCENGLVFSGDSNNQVRFRIPRNIGMAQLSSAYVEVDVQVGSQADVTQPCMQLDRIAGVQSCINQMTVRSHDSGRVIEQLRQYNQYAHLHYNSTNDEGIMNKRSRLEGCSGSYLISENPFASQNENCLVSEATGNGGQAANATTASTGLSVEGQCWKQLTRKVTLPLLGGVFGHAAAFPLMGIPLDVEILLEKSLRCLRAAEGSIDVNCQPTDVGGAVVATDVLIVSDRAKWSGMVGVNDAVLPLAINVGETAINPLANFPFRVGQKIAVKHTPTATGVEGIVISTIARIEVMSSAGTTVAPYPAGDVFGRIAITTAADWVPIGGATDISISVINANGAPVSDTAVGYTWSAPQLVIPKVVPSPGKVQAIANLMAKGEYSMDINSFALYSNAINGGQTSSTNIIPADLSRVKSILSVPIEQVNQDRLDNSNALAGQYLNAESYQYSINNILRPDRLVDLQREQFPANVDNVLADGIRRPYQLGKYPGALHLHEARKALIAANTNTMNLQFITKTMAQGGGYVIGRQLGSLGSSENLVARSVILYLNYISGASNSLKLLQNFLVHTRTIAVGLDGVSVQY